MGSDNNFDMSSTSRRRITDTSVTSCAVYRVGHTSTVRKGTSGEKFRTQAAELLLRMFRVLA